jgi:hypothetical protein
MRPKPPGYRSSSSDTSEEDESPSSSQGNKHAPPMKSSPKLYSINELLRSQSDDLVHRKSPSLNAKIQDIYRHRQASLPQQLRSPCPSRKGSFMVGSVRKQTASSIASASRSTMSSQGVYPPDTPDRPAPLSIISRGPKSAPIKPLSRSFSTPVRAQMTPRFACSPNVIRNSTSQGTRNASVGEARPVFLVCSSNADEKPVAFDAPGRLSGRHSPSNTMLHGDILDALQPRYELEPHELAESESNSPMAQSPYPSFESGGIAALDTGSVFEKNGKGIADAPKGVFQTDSHYVFGVRDEQSVDGTMFDIMNREPRTGHRLTNPQFRPLPVPQSAPTPAQSRIAAQSRHATRVPNFGAKSVFHRPLPLRSYESEAFLFPTARAQSSPHHNRAASLTTSPSRTHRPLDIGGLDEFSRRVGPSNLRIRNSPTKNSRASTGAILKHDSMESLNPAQSPDVPDSAATTGPGSLGHVYKAVTEAYIREALKRTRDRGAQLPIVDWQSLSSFEVAWRNANEQLLVAIYGQYDVTLTSADVTFVDRIANEMKNGVGQIAGYEWVGALFLRH